MPSVPDLVVSGAGLLTLRWAYGAGGAGGMNVLGIAWTGAAVVNQTMANSLDTAIKAALTSSGLVGDLHSTTSLVSVGVRDIRAAHMTEFIGTGGPVPGTGTGDALPRQVAFCVSLKTAFAGAAYRGRVYLGGFTEAVNQSTADAPTLLGTHAVAFVNAIDSALNAQQGDLAVVSRPAYAKDIVTTTHIPAGTDQVDTKHQAGRPGFVNAVTSVVARNTTWDSQRRRTAAGSVSTLFSLPVAYAEKGGNVVTVGAPEGRRR